MPLTKPEGTATTGRAVILCPKCRDLGSRWAHGCAACGRTRPRKQIRRILSLRQFNSGASVRQAVGRVGLPEATGLVTRARRLKLIVDHMPLARKVAKQVARKFAPHLSLEDFQQDAYLGLCEAARRCDKVSTFPAFAYFRVRGAIVDAHRRKQYREEQNPSLEGMAAIALARNHIHQSSGLRSYLAVIEPRDVGPLPDELAAEAELDAFAEAAIAELPPDERYVLREALDGVKLAAIAISCQRSPTWTRGKLASARGKVTAAMQQKAA